VNHAPGPGSKEPYSASLTVLAPVLPVPLLHGAWRLPFRSPLASVLLRCSAVPSLESLIARLPARPDGAALLDEFVPPPRFESRTFANYEPDPRFPSQAQAVGRLERAAAELRGETGALARFRARFGRSPRGRGIYLDGGFGVGKTHLLAALWHDAPEPKVFLSFDELVYTIGLLGLARSRDAFRGYRLAAVDEWELDDPGNLKLALAWLRGALADGLLVGVTSNTIPDELGRGRFSQKSFAGEIEELAAAFEVLRIDGEDYRHRHFEADPGREYFRDDEELERLASEAEGEVLISCFAPALRALRAVHPIRYGALVGEVDLLLQKHIRPIGELPDGLRWVHFIDKLYDAAVPFAASGEVPLANLFPPSFLQGAYGKKFGRCLSRMEELLAEQSLRPPVGRSSRGAIPVERGPG
jgi:cell division protein ZapE